MIKRFFVFLVRNWTYELSYIAEAFRLALVQTVFWVFSFLQMPVFGMAKWAYWIWVPVWIHCWILTAMSIGRFVQISGNRKNAITITNEQLRKIMDVYPKDEAYLCVDGRYMCIRPKSRNMPFDSATLIRLGKIPLSEKRKIKEILKNN